MTGPVDDAEAAYAACADALLIGLDAAIETWIARLITERSASVDPAEVLDAGRRTHAAIMPRLETLLRADVDAQSAGPLGVLRDAVDVPTAVLEAAGVPRPQRDEFARRNFPDDPYALGPATFDDVDLSLHEVGLRWGAAKAHLVLTRRRIRSGEG